MRVLIVGTSGQLATELRRVAPPAGVELLPACKLDLTQPRLVDDLLEAAQPELVINAAAYTAVDRAEAERDRAMAINAAGPELLARWCATRGAALFHLSTDYVFDGTKPTDYTEADAPCPINVYGESKLRGELLVQRASPRHLIVRTSWLFSAHGNNFVRTMLRLAAERDELRVVADQVGRPTPARDLAAALLELAERLAAQGELPWGTYHFAGTGPASWFELARTIVDAQADATGRRPRVVPIRSADYPTPAKRPHNSVLATERFEAELRILAGTMARRPGKRGAGAFG